MTAYTEGTPILGEVLKVMVEDPAAPGTFVEVSDMNDYSMSSSRPVREEKVFNKTRPLRSPSTVREQTWTVAGLVALGDFGQGILNAAELAGTTVNIKILHDGTNGFTCQVWVNSYKTDAKPDGSYQGISYDFTADADPVAVGTGWTNL